MKRILKYAAAAPIVAALQLSPAQAQDAYIVGVSGAMTGPVRNNFV